jgi:hypothetical protein
MRPSSETLARGGREQAAAAIRRSEAAAVQHRMRNDERRREDDARNRSFTNLLENPARCRFLSRSAEM